MTTNEKSPGVASEAFITFDVMVKLFVHKSWSIIFKFLLRHKTL